MCTIWANHSTQASHNADSNKNKNQFHEQHKASDAVRLCMARRCEHVRGIETNDEQSRWEL